MKKLLFFALGIVTLITSVTISGRASAISSNIISDGIFTNENAMNEGQINDFINRFPKSCLLPQNYPSNLSGSAMLEPLSYFSYGSSTTPARIIYKSAILFHLNPQVILATLEKEQGLVSGNTIDGGCYAWHYNSAMGYNCQDTLTLNDYPALGITRTCVENESHAGFSRQVSHATWQLRFDKERAYGNLSWGGDGNIFYAGRMTQGMRARSVYGTATWYDGLTTIDGQTFKLENGATAALYNYTPHFNSFERIFTNWFGSTHSDKPLSPLYKSENSPNIYAVSENKKFLVPSYDIMQSFGWSKYNVNVVSAEYLDQMSSGQAIATSIAKKKYDPSGTLYFFDDGKRYPIPLQACKVDPAGTPVPNSTWALDCFNSATTITLPNDLIDYFTAQDITLSSLAINRNMVWNMEQGKRRLVTSQTLIDSFGGWMQAKWMQDYHVQQPVGKVMLDEGDVVKFGDSPEISVATNSGSELSPVPSPDTYSQWNLSARPNKSLPAIASSGDKLPIASPLTYCATDGTSVSVITTDGKRMGLTFDRNYWPVNPDTCTKASTSTIATIPSIGANDVYRSSRGDIFTVGYGVWYIFPSINDLKQLGRAGVPVVNVTNSVQDSLVYGGANLAENRLFKASGSNEIRMVRQGGSLLIDSTNYPGLSYSSLITVDETTSKRYPITGVYVP